MVSSHGNFSSWMRPGENESWEGAVGLLHESMLHPTENNERDSNNEKDFRSEAHRMKILPCFPRIFHHVVVSHSFFQRDPRRCCLLSGNFLAHK